MRQSCCTHLYIHKKKRTVRAAQVFKDKQPKVLDVQPILNQDMHESISAAGTAGLLNITPCTRHKSACGALAPRKMEVEAPEADQGDINLPSWVKP